MYDLSYDLIVKEFLLPNPKAASVVAYEWREEK
jgi:hypothetical protein